MEKAKSAAVEVANANESHTPDSLIALAIQQPNLNVDALERLMAMRREFREEHAREAFAVAMAAFQAECPIIKKGKGVLNKDKTTVRYSYSPLEEIVKQTQKLREKHGFSHSFETEVTGTQVKVWCKITHQDGHSERSSFEVPTDPESYMNAPQKFASAMTYAKRYAFVNALGIVMGGEDDDANTAPRTNNKPTQDQLDRIDQLASSKGFTKAEVTGGFRKHYNASITEMTRVQADGYISILEKAPAKK